jgi:hypothetical protein
MCHKGRVLVIGDDDTADTLSSAVGVESVVCRMRM